LRRGQDYGPALPMGFLSWERALYPAHTLPRGISEMGFSWLQLLPR